MTHQGGPGNPWSQMWSYCVIPSAMGREGSWEISPLRSCGCAMATTNQRTPAQGWVLDKATQ